MRHASGTTAHHRIAAKRGLVCIVWTPLSRREDSAHLRTLARSRREASILAPRLQQWFAKTGLACSARVVSAQATVGSFVRLPEDCTLQLGRVLAWSHVASAVQ